MIYCTNNGILYVVDRKPKRVGAKAKPLSKMGEEAKPRGGERGV